MLDLIVYQNTLRLWLVALLTSLAIYLMLRLVLGLGLRQLNRLSRRTDTWIDDTIVQSFGSTSHVILAILALFLGAKVLTLPEAVDRWVDALAVIFILVQVGLWGNALIQNWANRYTQEAQEEAPAEVTTMQAAGFIGRLILFAVLGLFALDNIPGVEVTALIASLGIGGVAVALALQNILGDLFASLTIALDKPFVIGDFIQVGDFLGQVDYVGLKTTRLRSLSGEQLIFSNNDLLQSRIRNYQRLEERRIAFTVGVVYDTPADQLARIPGWIQEIIDGREDLRFDRAHFKGFGASSLDFEVVYFVLSPDYRQYMDAQQQINLALVDRFRAEQIAFAFPTRTIIVEGDGQLPPKQPGIAADAGGQAKVGNS